MNSTRRLLLIAGIIVVAGLGFIFAKASDNSSENFPQSTVAGIGSSTSGGDAGGKPRLVHELVIDVRGQRPVDGITRMTFRKGDTIRFQVRSDHAEEVHLHGYDVARDVAPGIPANFAVPATIEGVFEAELESSGTQIASITVEP
ncbi:MAG TPA: hypothetical protein VGM91_14445 [Conexibacter sp.]|jgi:hypothetical protein